MQKLKATLIALTCLLLVACQQDRAPNEAEQRQVDALQQSGLTLGEDYFLLKEPLPPAEGGKLSVREFFWYGCGHCYKVEQPVKHWLNQLPSQVVFEKVPASWKDSMVIHARAHYIADRLRAPGMLDGLFPAVMQVRKSEDLDEHKAAMQDYFARFYISSEEFEALWQDKQIDELVSRADRWQKQAGISGTPAIVIDGRFLVNNLALEDVTGIVKVADTMVRALLKAER